MARIIVLGGGLSGWAAAKAAAKAGHDVALADSHSFLGFELTATGHSWLRNGLTEGELHAPVGAMKKYFMQSLIDEGVDVLPIATPCGLALSKEAACGAVLAGKFGFMMAPADHVIDATANGAACYSDVRGGFVSASYVFECSGARTLYETVLGVPPELDVDGDKVYIHPSIVPSVLAVEFRFKDYWLGASCDRALLELKARQMAEQIFAHLKTLPRLEEIELTRMAGEALLQYEILGSHACAGVTRFNWPFSHDISTRDIENCVRAAEDMIAGLPRGKRRAAKPSALELFGQRVVRFELGAPEDALCGLSPVTFDFEDNMSVVDVSAAVIGAGTSGMQSARALIGEDVLTAVVEPFYQPGGTRTLGRVNGHWHGHIAGACARTNDQVTELSGTIRQNGRLTDGVARTLLYQKDLSGKCCVPFLGYTACGAVVRDGHLQGVAVCSEDHMVFLRAHTVVDMTSDADVACLAGLPYALGCPRDGFVMTNGQWGDSAWSMAHFGDNPYCRDYDMILNDTYADLARAIITAHGYNSDIDFSPLNTMRESRRIAGRHTLTLSEVILRRPVPDAVAMTDTPYDVHGRASSALLWMGLGGGKRRAQISYGCFLPQGLEGLLVGGKSLSATRDASCLCRMNADVENAGYALGLAAAQSVREGCDASQIDVDALRARLIREGCILAEFEPPVGADEAAAAIIAGENDALVFALLQPRDEIVPRLSALAGENELAAMALCWFGEEAGVRRVIDMINQARDVEDLSLLLSPKGYGRRGAVYEGDPAAVYGDDISGYYLINRLIVLLGASASPLGLPVLVELAGRAQAGGAPIMGEGPYHKNRLDARTVPGFERIACLCFALERLAGSAAIEPLESLLNQSHVGGWLQKGKIDPLSLTKCAWLELGVARALARCGGRAGYARLADYTEDGRLVCSKHAMSELNALTGQAFGADARAWHEWLNKQDNFSCMPYDRMQVD